MNSKVQKLLAVIKDPASSDNEKEIARRILEEYKAQGIDINEEEELGFHVFKFSTKFEYQFLFQIVWNVLGDNARGRKQYNYRKTVEIQCTKMEYIEISQKFKFYLRDYNKQLEVFYSAYVQRNHLWSTATQKEDKQYTPEEIEEQLKAMKMASWIEVAEFLPQLTTWSNAKKA